MRDLSPENVAEWRARVALLANDAPDCARLAAHVEADALSRGSVVRTRADARGSVSGSESCWLACEHLGAASPSTSAWLTFARGVPPCSTTIDRLHALQPALARESARSETLARAQREPAAGSRSVRPAPRAEQDSRGEAASVPARSSQEELA